MALRSNFAKLHAKGLRNFLSVGQNGPNLNVYKSYENIDDGSVNSYMEKNPDTINLEWYHHMKSWKRFCDEEKILRQQRKEGK
jgi:DNA phosphorothioation-dependent restriction protein DptG